MPNKTLKKHSKKNMKNKKKGKSIKVGRVVIKKPQTRKKLVDDIYEDYLSFYYDYGYKGSKLDVLKIKEIEKNTKIKMVENIYNN